MNDDQLAEAGDASGCRRRLGPESPVFDDSLLFFGRPAGVDRQQ